MMTPIELKRKRLRHQSLYRGCKEMDAILGRFSESLKDFNAGELDRYEALLQESDWDIYAWVTKKEALPDRLKTCVATQKLMAFCA